ERAALAARLEGYGLADLAARLRRIELPPQDGTPHEGTALLAAAYALALARRQRCTPVWLESA
ncbi:hypothetical protein MTR62_21145, partial [Novosphingobium sp. 1949]